MALQLERIDHKSPITRAMQIIQFYKTQVADLHTQYMDYDSETNTINVVFEFQHRTKPDKMKVVTYSIRNVKDYGLFIVTVTYMLNTHILGHRHKQKPPKNIITFKEIEEYDKEVEMKVRLQYEGKIHSKYFIESKKITNNMIDMFASLEERIYITNKDNSIINVLLVGNVVKSKIMRLKRMIKELSTMGTQDSTLNPLLTIYEEN